MNQHSRLWFGIFVSLVFVAGAATGSLLERVFNKPPTPAIMVGPRGLPFAPGLAMLAPPDVMASMLTRELKLDDAQRQKIEAIFAARQGRLRELREAMRDRFDHARQEIDTEIDRVLTPDQRKRLQTLNESRRVTPDVLPLPGPPGPESSPPR